MRQAEDRLPVVTVNVFPGGFNWGLYVGRDRGFFAKHGIAVEIQDTPDSVSQMTNFSQGRFDIAMTGVDNIVAYVEGQGQAPIGPQPEFFAFMGSDSAFLSLVTSADVADIASLRGRTLSVDAITTGYAFVLYDIMRRHGLDKDKGHYAIVGAGGMVQRWTALREGRHDGTLLSAPYNLIAKSAGFREHAKAVDVIGPYQGNVGAARRSWAYSNSDKIVAYIRGYRDSIAWLYDTLNLGTAVEILRRNIPQMTQDVARSSYSELLARPGGFFPACEISAQGLDCVLELRERYAQPSKALGTAEKYCDLSFLKAAQQYTQ